MSMMNTLVKVAIGVAVAKGVSSMTKSARRSTTTARSGSTRSSGVATGLEDMMGAILGGKTGSIRSSGAGGIGDLLNELGGAGRGTTTPRTTTRRTASSNDAIGDLLGGLLGGSGSSGSSSGSLGGLGSLLGAGAAGGLGGLLGGMLSGGGLGSRLNSAFANGGEPATPPQASEEAAAAIFLKAMIQAAKCDGQIDAAEQENLMKHLGEVTAAERSFVETALAAPVDVEGLARAVPEGLEAQTYTMSLMAIDLDSQTEAQYLHELAQALGLEPATVNHIHDQIGAPKLYA